MTTLPHSDFPLAPASVGPALPGGLLEIEDADENGRGEVLYRGPNVMMGYAERRGDLAKGDELHGLLRTHDLGFLDGAGRLTLTGRASRSGKVYGLRVSLDEVEQLASSVCPSAVIQCGEGLCVFHEEASESDLSEVLNARFTLPPVAYRFIPIERLPRTERGKVDYRALQELA
jgi:acyl-CoA synthetase (AMP-forming)/AMP-acid ligase II